MTHNAEQKSCAKKLINREINNDICKQVTAITMCNYSTDSTQRE